MRFVCFYFWSGRVNFQISFTVPSHISMMFNFVRSTAFLTFRAISSTRKYRVTPLPIVVTLRYTRVYIGSFNSGNTITKIKKVVNKKLSLGTVL